MKIDDYNPKAREAIARNDLEISTGIFKGIVYVTALMPITFICKAAIEGANWSQIVNNLRHFVGMDQHITARYLHRFFQEWLP